MIITKRVATLRRSNYQHAILNFLNNFILPVQIEPELRLLHTFRSTCQCCYYTIVKSLKRNLNVQRDCIIIRLEMWSIETKTYNFACILDFSRFFVPQTFHSKSIGEKSSHNTKKPPPDSSRPHN
ncbi:hypothetical protein TcasGA2_TC002679 [Tribolium castaneum]|uniref:Uncharacterized protein n=1 Tax=Tribolium castaneum TaxID=7070 RepID=D6WEB4_TRICA|nr:hypothetical protein TcasGA2_TC002679 [Tribolium castaneum]